MLELIGKTLTNSFYENPIFVVGSGRSGTSVLLQALGKHTNILAMRGEAPFYTSLGGDTYNFELAHNHDYFTRSLHVNKQYFYQQLKKIGFESASGRYYGLRYMLRALFTERKNLSRCHYWALKTFPPEKSTKGLLTLFPKAKFVYITRNGIDVVNSMAKFHGFREMDFETHCHKWTNEATKYHYLLDHPHASHVRHEDLVKNPTVFFTKIFSFLNLPPESGVAQFTSNTVVHPLDQGDQTNINAKELFGSRESPFKTWDTDRQALFIKICGKAMTKLSYKIPQVGSDTHEQ